MLLFRFITLLLLPVAAFATTDENTELRLAQEMLTAGQYADAFAEYERLAKTTHQPLAYFTLGMFYEQGWGRQVDKAEACRHYEQAAKGDIPTATHFLAQCLINGVHQPANPALAAQWFQKAADLGHYTSLCSLGELYFEGKGVSQDNDRGLQLCRQAAERGSLPAIERVARFYLEGEEKLRDPAMALQWLEIAAQRNSPASQFQLGIMLREGLGHSVDLHTARYWFESAASQGYRQAYLPTAELYFNTPKDPASGLWPEAELAKAYLWLSATKKQHLNKADKKQAQLMLEQVLDVIPDSWLKDLDVQVKAHLTLYPAPSS